MTALMNANGATTATVIHPGQTLCLPGAAAAAPTGAHDADHTDNTTPAPAPPAAPPAVAIDIFPVQGPCSFGDTYGAPRSGGRVHEGVDIIAKAGQYVYAVKDGVLTKKYIDAPGSLSGNGWRLTIADGTYFFYAHLSTFAAGLVRRFSGEGRPDHRTGRHDGRRAHSAHPLRGPPRRWCVGEPDTHRQGCRRLQEHNGPTPAQRNSATPGTDDHANAPLHQQRPRHPRRRRPPRSRATRRSPTAATSPTRPAHRGHAEWRRARPLSGVRAPSRSLRGRTGRAGGRRCAR